MNFGDKIKYLREIAELSQTELGKALGMTQRRISYIENNKYEPSLADIKDFCIFFNVSADYLLDIPSPAKDNKTPQTDR